MSPTLVLASTSAYRRELLARLQLPFAVARPDIDETPLPGEPAEQTALRLAEAKARAVAIHHPDSLIIGSDQVALLDGEQLGKPGHHAAAVAQLQKMRGRRVVFHTALALLDSRSGQAEVVDVPYEVQLRQYSDALIERYLRTEQPYDCAGSAKTEGLGVTLIEWMRGDDPSALIGLPLMALTTLLQRAGLPPLGVI